MGKHRFIFAGIIVCLIISFFTKDLSLFLFGLGAGTTGGLLIEYIGVRVIRLWDYAGGGLPVRVILRGWGETGAVAVIAIQWIPHFGIALLAGFLFPLLIFELPNIRAKGWSYHAPSWIVIMGWGITTSSFQSTVALLSGRGF